MMVRRSQDSSRTFFSQHRKKRPVRTYVSGRPYDFKNRLNDNHYRVRLSRPSRLNIPAIIDLAIRESLVQMYHNRRPPFGLRLWVLRSSLLHRKYLKNGSLLFVNDTAKLCLDSLFAGKLYFNALL
jgi:hypothetical protein